MNNSTCHLLIFKTNSSLCLRSCGICSNSICHKLNRKWCCAIWNRNHVKFFYSTYVLDFQINFLPQTTWAAIVFSSTKPNISPHSLSSKKVLSVFPHWPATPIIQKLKLGMIQGEPQQNWTYLIFQHSPQNNLFLSLFHHLSCYQKPNCLCQNMENIEYNRIQLLA